MSRYRSDHEGIDVRHQDGAARGEGVGGRTRRSGNDQAVGLITRNERLINVHIAMIQPCNRALAYHNIIERVITCNGRAPAYHFAMHHGTHVYSAGSLV